jgi:hypothetical protein
MHCQLLAAFRHHWILVAARGELKNDALNVLEQIASVVQINGGTDARHTGRAGRGIQAGRRDRSRRSPPYGQ